MENKRNQLPAAAFYAVVLPSSRLLENSCGILYNTSMKEPETEDWEVYI